MGPVLAALAAAAVLFVGCRHSVSLPDSDSDAYREVVVSFYTSLAAVQSGGDLGAADYLARVTELAPGEPAAWANLGLLALRRNELVEAERYLTRATTLAPESAEIHHLRAALYSQQGDFDASIEALRTAVRLDPEDPKALHALAEAVERRGDHESMEESAAILARLGDLLPGNLAVVVERMRLALLLDDTAALSSLLAVVELRSQEWPRDIRDLVDVTASAIEADDLSSGGTQLAFLRNALLSIPSFRRDLVQIRTSSAQVGDLVTRFMRLEQPVPGSAHADTAITFSRQASPVSDPVTWSRIAWAGSEHEPVPAALRDGEITVGGSVIRGITGTDVSMAQGDLNFDYIADVIVVSSTGVRLFEQDSTGSFADATSRLPPSIMRDGYSGAWPFDIDLDGDLDVVLGRRRGPPVVARNNGDGTFTRQEPLEWVDGVIDFAWGDLDADGDPDPVLLGTSGQLGGWTNEREAQFVRLDLPALSSRGIALRSADLDGDGLLDLLVRTEDGAVVSVTRSHEGAWSVANVIRESMIDPGGPGFLAVADIDNNGLLDLVTSSDGETALWLGDGSQAFIRVSVSGTVHVGAVADLDDDGRLDLIGFDRDSAATWWRNDGIAGYHWQKLRPRATQVTGDQRINALAYGSRIELRTGLLYQQQFVSEPVVHFGLGRHERASLVRVVWPNGDVQAEFELASDQTVNTPQRLKGSCPWVFTYDGDQIRFVTDFLWRSPLGLRINAQETADVMTTGDWIRIRGDQLRPRDRFYDVRITAELWETHFFDHVALKVVDHPPDAEVFVDERFAFPPPPLELHALSRPRPIARAVDSAGRDVTDRVRTRDDVHAGAVELGMYQGIAKEHFIEIDLGDGVPSDSAVVLVASGWVRPTDSSINIAISQGSQTPPWSLQVEVPDGNGGWRVLHNDYGFPSGKDKTILIPVGGGSNDGSGPGAARRVRLRTNMEVYWDQIEWAPRRPDVSVRVRTIRPSTADLRYRGFSALERSNDRSPERPNYDRIESTAPIWMDLEGYYTRFGDVRPLLEEVDDRYVIMNAGDELLLEFPAEEAPPQGWTRSFVLVGDGWVKDGDFNTTASETVRPLPMHAEPAYASTDAPLSQDPVFVRHAADWLHYHTRYVDSGGFHRALQPTIALDSRR